MAISLSNQSTQKINFTTRFFWNLVIFLLILLVVFGFLKFYDANLNARIKDTKIAIQDIDSKRDVDLEKKMKNTLDTFEKVEPLLQQHTQASKLLSFIEKNTYQNVTFSNFAYNREDNSVSLYANAPSASLLSMQLAVLGDSKNIQSIEVSSFAVGKGGVNLQIKLIMDPLLAKF
jgi:Sec-independent protein translocase protein TatA